MPSISTAANVIVAVMRATRRSNVFFMVIVVLCIIFFDRNYSSYRNDRSDRD